MAQDQVNDNMFMICGGAGDGKSASLQDLENPEGVWYYGCEAGKKLPFRSKFREFIIMDPEQLFEAFDAAEADKSVHTQVIDSQTYMMDMFESVHVLTAADTMKGWSRYQQFFKTLMQQYVARATTNVIFTAHVEQVLNEQTMILESKVPVKGALKKNGIESFFSTIVTARKMTLDKLSKYANPLLHITEDDEIVGYKHVFQTRPTKETVGERGMRAPLGMWSIPETFIDNNSQQLLTRLKEFYA